MAYNFFQGRSRGFAILPPDPSFVAIDFETANHDRASACAVGMARVERGRIVEQATRLLCPPDSYFSFTHIHGLAWDDVADAPSFRDGWRELKALLEGAHFLAAHNAPFDQSVLRACCRQARLRPPPQPFVCTVALAREVWDTQVVKAPANILVHLGPGSSSPAWQYPALLPAEPTAGGADDCPNRGKRTTPVPCALHTPAKMVGAHVAKLDLDYRALMPRKA